MLHGQKSEDKHVEPRSLVDHNHKREKTKQKTKYWDKQLRIWF